MPKMRRVGATSRAVKKLLFSFFLCLPAWGANTYTTRVSLPKPADLDTNWGVPYRSAMDILDSSACYQGLVNTFTAPQTFASTTTIRTTSDPALTIDNETVGNYTATVKWCGTPSCTAGSYFGYSSITNPFGDQLNQPGLSIFSNNKTEYVRFDPVNGVTVAGLTPNQFVMTNANRTLVSTTTFAGGSSSLSSTQTWTGQNQWTTPAQSTFTYGLTAGSVTVNGSGAGAIQFNEGADSTAYGPTSNKDNLWASSSSHTFVFNPNITSTYTVVGSSTSVITPGNVAVWTSQFGLRDGGTDLSQLSPPINTVLYNNNGPVGNSSNFQFNGTSVTILSSTSFTTSGSQNTINPAYVDIFDGKPGSPYLGKPLFTVGSFNQSAQLGVYDQTRIDESRYGAKVGHLEVGESSSLINHQIQDDNASTQLINWWNNGEMDIQTATNGNGGKSIVFLPNSVSEMTISSVAITITTGTVIDISTAPTGFFQDPAGLTLKRMPNVPNCEVWTDTNDYVSNQKPFAICKNASDWSFGYQNNIGGMTNIFQISSNGAFPIGSTVTVNVPLILGGDPNIFSPVSIKDASSAYELKTSSTSTFFHVQVSTSGHFLTNGPSPVISSCGTTPNGSVVGDDNEGTITVGGGSVTSCTLTFAKTWGTTPICVITDNSTTSTGDVSAISATAFTTSFSLSVGGGTIWYRCGCSGSGCK